ncbi:MAG TPA: recombination mediator RecR [Gammaproteobacteria bacterium]|nr:recombination mediator RecR [Gammaproteobacteria bacterium]
MASVLPPALSELVAALRCLPGVGPKSAQRAAFHLIERDREGAERLAHALVHAGRAVTHCRRCRMLAEAELCVICANPNRNERELVVVESPSDVAAIEGATSYAGHYFVLMGRLSPIDGIGPAELGAAELEARLASGVEEVIVATGATVEGEATAHWIGEIAHRHGVRATRIAHGVPVGGELDYVDGSTLARAFSGRRSVED